MSETAPEQRRRPIPKAIREACEALVSGRAKNLTAAAKLAKISREHLSRSLSQSHVAEYLRQRAARTVAIGSGRAAARIIELLDAKSEHVALEASHRVLAISAIKPPADAQLNVNVELRAGFVIDLSGPGEARPMKVVSSAPAAIVADAPAAARTAITRS